MKKYFTIMLVALTMAGLTSCKGIIKKAVDGVIEAGGTKEMPMDSPETWQEIQTIVDGLDANLHICGISVDNEGVSSRCSNNLGNVSVRFINADNDFMSQIVYPVLSDPTSFSRNENVTYETVKPLGFSAEQAIKDIEACKAMIPEGYKYLNLEKYVRGFVNLRSTDYSTELTINIQEVGKEQIEANGKKSDVYYQLGFEIKPDGSIKMSEK